MNMICNMYLYIYAYKYIYRVNLIISPAWICPWSTVIQNAFLFTISFYLELFRQTHDSHDECCQPKKTCFFIGVCSVKVFYTVSAKKNTHWCREGRKTLPSAIFVFKRSLRQVQETDRTGSMEATMTVYKLGQLGGEFPRKNYPPKVGVSMIKSLS